MVDQIKKSILKNLKDINSSDLSLTKFNHGRDYPYSKVLFLVSDKEKIIGIVKIVRDKKYNRKIENEFEAQKKSNNHSLVIKKPNIYFSEIINGHFAYMEEYLENGPIGMKDASKYLNKVFSYQQNINKEKNISTKALVDIFSNQKIRDNQKKERYKTLISNLQNLEGSVYKAENHGDLTYMNICDMDGSLYLIDWENYGERKIWGIDFVHYFIRSFPIENLDEFNKYLAQFNKDNNLSLDLKYFEKIYIIDQLYDLLEKNNREIYLEVCNDIDQYD
jgi:hypothetical protein